MSSARKPYLLYLNMKCIKLKSSFLIVCKTDSYIFISIIIFSFLSLHTFSKRYLSSFLLSFHCIQFPKVKEVPLQNSIWCDINVSKNQSSVRKNRINMTNKIL